MGGTDYTNTISESVSNRRTDRRTDGQTDRGKLECPLAIVTGHKERNSPPLARNTALKRINKKYKFAISANS